MNTDAAVSHALTTDCGSLPVIDLGLDDGDGNALAGAIAAACRGHGFFYLVNHGVPGALMRAVSEQARGLFALDDAAKHALAAAAPFGLGYGRMGGRMIDGRPGAAVKEEYYCGREGVPGQHDANRWPVDLPGFRATMEHYIEAMHALAERMMALMARSLTLPPAHFADFCHQPLAKLRLVRYPPEGAEAGAHTDFGALTFLLQDAIGGLQIFDRLTGGWIHAAPIPGSFVVNLGDLFEVWTNRAYRSTSHRVVHPAGPARISVPFFYTGAADHLVECLPRFRPLAGGAVLAPITPSGHLRQANEAQGF